MELQDYLRVVRKRWRVIVTAVLLCRHGGERGDASPAPKVYESRTQFFVSTTGSDDSGALLQGSTFTQQRVKSYAQLLDDTSHPLPGRRPPWASRVTSRTRSRPPPHRTPCSSRWPSGTPTRNRPKAIGEAIATEFPATVTRAREPRGDGGEPRQGDRRAAPDHTGRARERRSRCATSSSGRFSDCSWVSGAALVRETRWTRRSRPWTTSRPSPMPPSSAPSPTTRMPPSGPSSSEVDPRSPRAEAFRSLRTNLQFIDAANHPRTLVVTSSLAGEGKSTMSANLAITMAQAGSRVCLVEADLRRPKVLQYMGLEGGVGLTDALIGRADVFDVLQPYGSSRLWVLGAGPIPPNPSELLGSSGMVTVLDKLLGSFDYVVMDAPPTLPVTDAVVISKLVDGAIVVVGSGMVQRQQLARTLELLGSVNGRVLGLVINLVSASDVHHYGGYGYHAAEDPRAKRPARPHAVVAEDNPGSSRARSSDRQPAVLPRMSSAAESSPVPAPATDS